MGQGNTIVSHFVVERGSFTVAIACVPCGPRRSLIYAWAWGFWVCWKLSASEQVKPDCCYTPAVVSTLLTPLPVSCPLTTPHHCIYVHKRCHVKLSFPNNNIKHSHFEFLPSMPMSQFWPIFRRMPPFKFSISKYSTQWLDNVQMGNETILICFWAKDIAYKL